MSRFSGKCDFCDEIETVGLDKILNAESWVDIEEDRYGHFASHDYYRKILQEELKSALVGNETVNF